MTATQTPLSLDDLPQEVRPVAHRLEALGLPDRSSVWKRLAGDGWQVKPLLDDLHHTTDLQGGGR
jgi:hypothetical protein